jgi:GST-like protein
MIDLYTFTTPNGRKPAIMLEELEMPYTIHKIDITKDDQFSAEFVEINPNSKIPVIVDRDADIAVFESGAILIYLAEKTGSKLLPTEGRDRAQVIEWLMFQMASVGPMFGQLGHFSIHAPEKVPYGIERYKKETKRLLGVLDRQFTERDYMAGDYSIADIATYPWVFALTTADMGVSLDDFPQVQNWVKRLKERPAVQVGMDVLKPSFKSSVGKLAA